MIELAAILRLVSQRKLAEAETACREILRHVAEDAEATHLLGLILHQQGRSEEACRLLQRSIELDPANARFQLNFAGVLGSLSRGESALEHAQAAVRLDAASGLAHHNLGVALESARRLGE